MGLWPRRLPRLELGDLVPLAAGWAGLVETVGLGDDQHPGGEPRPTLVASARAHEPQRRAVRHRDRPGRPPLASRPAFRQEFPVSRALHHRQNVARPFVLGHIHVGQSEHHRLPDLEQVKEQHDEETAERLAALARPGAVESRPEPGVHGVEVEPGHRLAVHAKPTPLVAPVRDGDLLLGKPPHGSQPRGASEREAAFHLAEQIQPDRMSAQNAPGHRGQHHAAPPQTIVFSSSETKR